MKATLQLTVWKVGEAQQHDEDLTKSAGVYLGGPGGDFVFVSAIHARENAEALRKAAYELDRIADAVTDPDRPSVHDGHEYRIDTWTVGVDYGDDYGVEVTAVVDCETGEVTAIDNSL